MRIKVALILHIIVLLTAGITIDLYAYKTDTHQNMTAKAADLSTRYHQFISEFKFELNASRGFMVVGSFAEDETPRFGNHFYDPINGNGLGIFLPAITWGYRTEGLGLFNNEYSWTKAREYLYIALTGKNFNGETVAATTEQQNEYFKLLFRSLGQVVHLVQDMAQPSHTRNDSHASHYESEATAFLVNPSHLEDWAQFHGSEVAAIINAATGPQSTVSFNSSFITLALLSNRNFFSDDTIFKNYPQPSKDETNDTDSLFQFGISGEPAQVLAEDGQIYEVPYIIKTRGAFAGSKLAQVGYFGDLLFSFPDEIRYLAFLIDDEVAKENAQILVPQAVGYSAGLLNYFFRGELDTQADGSDGILITNLSTEDMNGTFELYYDSTDGTRKQALGAAWTFPLAAGDTSNHLTYIPPTDAERPGEYILVFQGTLGAELGAVVGKIVQLSTVWIEDWEGATAYYLQRRLYPDFIFEEFGSKTFTTRNGTWTMDCKVHSDELEVSIKDKVGTSPDFSLHQRIGPSPLAQCSIQLTLKQKLSLSRFKFIDIDFYLDNLNICGNSPLCNVPTGFAGFDLFVIFNLEDPNNSNFFISSIGTSTLFNSPLYHYMHSGWQTRHTDIAGFLKGVRQWNLTDEQINKLSIKEIFIFSDFAPFVCCYIIGSGELAIDNIRIYGE